jgi:hypothetical protein
VKGRKWWDQWGSELDYLRVVDQVKNKSLRVTTAIIIIIMITMNIDYRITLNCIYNPNNNNNEIHIP